MQTDDVHNLIEHSFLARVPEIMAAEKAFTIEEAIQKAYDTEFDLLVELSGPRSTERAEMIVKTLSAKVYQRLRARLTS